MAVTKTFPDFCIQNGQTTFFGVEYYGECFCGDSLAPTATVADSSLCSFPCDQNRTQICGGQNQLDIYVLTPGAYGGGSY
ncbi:hypothetical protein MMC25_007608 [Agyrium rufum]|nr:hypothetical protein [Agyrium rufum]